MTRVSHISNLQQNKLHHLGDTDGDYDNNSQYKYYV